VEDARSHSACDSPARSVSLPSRRIRASTPGAVSSALGTLDLSSLPPTAPGLERLLPWIAHQVLAARLLFGFSVSNFFIAADRIRLRSFCKNALSGPMRESGISSPSGVSSFPVRSLIDTSCSARPLRSNLRASLMAILLEPFPIRLEPARPVYRQKCSLLRWQFVSLLG
jgi:hypothetical protein